MKNRFILALLMLLFATGAKAQDSGEGSHKAVAGNTTAEIGFNFNNGTFLQDGNLRFRHFIADETAIRLGLGAGYTYNKLGEEAHNSAFSLRIAPGIEKHFAGTDRLSPYVGIELPIGFTSVYYEDQNVIYRGSSRPNFPITPGRSNFSFGLNGVAGVDYYFATHFYTGFEIGAGFAYLKNGDIEAENKNTQAISSIKGYHTVTFSPFATAGIRLGFVF